MSCIESIIITTISISVTVKEYIMVTNPQLICHNSKSRWVNHMHTWVIKLVGQ